MPLRDRDGARLGFIIALLAAVFVLTAALAFRAVAGSQYHRAAAERVVLDWNTIAADELARRAENMASFYGVYPILQAALPEPLPPPRERVQELLRGHAKRYARLVLATFRADLANGKVVASSPLQLPPLDWSAESKVAHAGGHTFAWMVAPDNRTAIGVDVDRGAFGTFFNLAMAQRPLLPQSLAHGRITNDTIAVKVRDAQGRTLFASKRPLDRTLAAHHDVKGGLLDGFRIDAAIAPDVAPLLVFGGLPRSALPVYGGILAVTALLLAIAVVQLRRERALARLRSDFVASVSHELRTPLTQIRMFAETLLLDRVRTDDERKRSLSIIDQETRRLAQVVENVLQFSRGERGTLRVARSETDVAALLRETLELFAPIAAARNVRVTLQAPETLAADVDDGAVRQIVLNLLDNAVKYGPVGQEVIVTAERDDSRVRIAVDDEGPGIPQHERRRIWRRYHRLARERERAIAGAGIGLAVVHELVVLHGGSARVETGSRGGARFVVELS